MFPEYILTNNGVATGSNISLLQLKAGVNGPIEILRFWITQSTNTSSSQMSGGLIRKSGAATVVAAVAGTTLLKQNPISPTADASLGTTATGITASAEGTDGELSIVKGFNILTGLEHLFTPDERLLVPQGGIVAVKLIAGAVSCTWYAGIHFRELRGS